MTPVAKIQFFRFCLVGLANTAASLTAIFAAKALLGWTDLPANAAGYAIGLTISFFANRRWTFDHRGQPGSAAGRFLLAFAIAYGTNLATVFGLIHLAGVDSYLAQAAGMPPYTLVFFLISRHFVFADGSAPAAVEPSIPDTWLARTRPAATLLTLLLLAVAGYRGGALLLSEPMLAVANNYDMVRIHACIKAYPIRAPGVHPFSPSVDAPLSRYQFRYDLEADCFFSTEGLKGWTPGARIG
jgi:putative flippase GtrA